MQSEPCTSELPTSNFKRVAYIAIGMFAISFFLPALVVDNGGTLEVWPGWFCFVYSPLALFFLQLEVFANWFFCAAFIRLLRREFRRAKNDAMVGLLLASETFSLFFLHLPANEGGVGPGMVIKYPHIGFLLWYGSLWLIFAYAKSRLDNPQEATFDSK